MAGRLKVKKKELGDNVGVTSIPNYTNVYQSEAEINGQQTNVVS
jgi:maltose-binding protein MalE